MSAFFLDTHAWVWSLTADAQLSKAATVAIEQADSLFVSPISFYEIAQKVRIGKWPEMAPYVDQLASLRENQGGLIAALGPEICLNAGLMKWEHRDPFDRFIGATALQHSMPIISADKVFDTLSGVTRIW